MTQTCVSIPQTSAWSRPAEVEAVGLGRREADLLDGSTSGGRCSATSATVLPNPFGYCSVTRSGPRSPRRPRPGSRPRAATSSKSGRLAKGLLDVDHDERRPLGIELPHAATPIATRAAGRRPGRRRRSSARARAACGPRSRSCRAALPALGPGLPLGLEVAERELASAPCASVGALEARTPRRRRPVVRSRSPVEHAGHDQLGVEAGKCGLEPVTPIAACSNGTSFSSAECGAWSVAMQSIRPERIASRSAWRSASARNGGFILKCESRLDRLVGERQVMRRRPRR